MMINKFGERVLDEGDLCDIMMQGHDVTVLPRVTVAPSVNLQTLIQQVQDPSMLLTWNFCETSDMSVPDFDAGKQATWFMPDEYQRLDIAQYVLSLCKTDAELQRVGSELLLFQQHDLFDLLRYLHYLVTVLKQNRVIWGVGRGSSVASYVLYLLGVHRVDSLYYDLEPTEFLR